MEKVIRKIDEYEDIINLPHHISEKRVKMPIPDRAAQFSPFAAVVGHEEAIYETARNTENRKELDEMEKAIIDEKLREIIERIPKKREVEIVYFESDIIKKGGEYVSRIGYVKKIDSYTREVVFTDGAKIAIEDIYHIEL